MLHVINKLYCNKKTHKSQKSNKITKWFLQHFPSVKGQCLCLRKTMKAKSWTLEKNTEPWWIMGNDGGFRVWWMWRERCLMLRKKGQHAAAQRRWKQVNASFRERAGNVQEYLQKNGKIIMSFNVCTKYWNSLKRLEKLISIELLKKAQNKSQ